MSLTVEDTIATLLQHGAQDLEVSFGKNSPVSLRYDAARAEELWSVWQWDVESKRVDGQRVGACMGEKLSLDAAIKLAKEIAGKTVIPDGDEEDGNG